MNTKVGRFTIPVTGYKFPTILTMKSGARGRKERGEYHVWTARLQAKGRDVIICRALAVLDPGERFRRIGIEMRTAKTHWERWQYRVTWMSVLGRGQHIKAIRPATLRETRRWLDAHPDDKKHAVALKVNGKFAGLDSSRGKERR